VWAGALVLAAFMLGIALGALAAARWGPRVRRAAVAYAGAELVVALSGSLLVWGLPAAEPLIGALLAPLAGQSGLYAAARLLLALAAMLVPTVAMGVTLPLGMRILADKETTRALGTLYAANTFGACVAPLAAEYYLIEALGLRGCALVAAALNCLAAGLALLAPSARAVPSPASAAGPMPHGRLLGAAALAGALALALEVLWFRLLLLYAPGTEASFALMLTLLLAGIALGGAVAPLAARLAPAWAAAACGAAVVAGYWLAAPTRQPGLAQLLDYAVPLMLPAAFCSGLLFTLLGAALRGTAGDPQPAIGRLACANTLGGAAGAAAGGFLLLPWLGIEASLFLLAAGYVAVVALLSMPAWGWRRLAPAALAGIALLAFPFGRMDAHLAQAARLYRWVDGSSVAAVTQGPTTTLQVLRRERFGEAADWRLLTDSYSMSGVDRDSARYMQLFAWLPLALHSRPRQALLISYGAGNTAQALLSDPALASLTVVDVSPEILQASGLIHGGADPLRDARVRVVLEDGRHFLATRPDRYDVITGEPPPPMMAGVVNLYTREYFAALAARLAPGGLATYWLPVHQFEPRGARAVIAAWCLAFPDCSLWAGSNFHWILLGGREFAGRPAVDHFARLWRVRPSAPLIAANGLEHPAQLGAAFLADAAQLREWSADAPPLDDDHPKRLAAPPPANSPLDDYARWLVPEGARSRFTASPWVAAHWPRELMRDSEAFFRVQPILNGQITPHPTRNLVLVDRLLRSTRLEMPIYWLLGSDLVEQRILERRRERPDQAYARGVRALAERDYAAAAKYFGQAAKDDPGELAPLATYSACRAASRRDCIGVRPN